MNFTRVGAGRKGQARPKRQETEIGAELQRERKEKQRKGAETEGGFQGNTSDTETKTKGDKSTGMLTEGAVESVRGQPGSHDEEHAGPADPRPPLHESGAAAAERDRDEHHHDDVCAKTQNRGQHQDRPEVDVSGA